MEVNYDTIARDARLRAKQAFWRGNSATLWP